MGPVVRSPAVGLVGLGVLTVIAVELLRGSIDLSQAAVRALVLLVVVGVVERALLPAARLVVGDPARRKHESGDPPG